MQFIVQVPDNKAPFFLELARSLKFVKVSPDSIADEEPTKEQLKAEIRQAVREVNLIKKGKLKSRPIEDLLNEL